MLASTALTLLLAACDGSGTPSAENAEPVPAPDPAPKEAAAAGWDVELPKGLTKAPVIPADNAMTDDKIALGHDLFLDTRLSVDGSRSCYSCHVNERGGADGRKKALGAGDKPLPRNTPTIWNVGYLRAWYWDGRATSLEAQAIGAWKGGNMGVGDGLDAKAAEIGALPEYAERFKAVFGLGEGEAVTPDHVAKAISAYERTLLCGDPSAEMDEAATRGKALFQGKGRCITCHTPPYYTDSLYHNIGLGYAADGTALPDADPGRGKHTGNEADNGKFRTPTLRNVARTGPYFHDGREPSLEAAVRYMARGGNANDPNLDPILKVPTKLTDAEIEDIVSFLEWLVCETEIEVKGDPKPVATDG